MMEGVLDLRGPLDPFPILYPRITWSAGVPVNIKKYKDSARTILAYDTTITWAGGVPITVAEYNVIAGTTKTTNIPWVNGLPFP